MRDGAAHTINYCLSNGVILKHILSFLNLLCLNNKKNMCSKHALFINCVSHDFVLYSKCFFRISCSILVLSVYSIWRIKPKIKLKMYNGRFYGTDPSEFVCLFRFGWMLGCTAQHVWLLSRGSLSFLQVSLFSG